MKLSNDFNLTDDALIKFLWSDRTEEHYRVIHVPDSAQRVLGERALTPAFTVGSRLRLVHSFMEEMFRDVMSGAVKPVRQIRVSMWNLSRLDTQLTLWGGTPAERWSALDDATAELNGQFGRPDKPA